MSTLRKAAQQALEALENPDGIDEYNRSISDSAIIALRAALAEPEQEPVAWNWMQDGQCYSPAYYGPPPDDDVVRIGLANGRSVRLLYTAPMPRKPLTEPELHAINPTWPAPGQEWGYEEVLAFARAIERAHGIGEQT